MRGFGGKFIYMATHFAHGAGKFALTTQTNPFKTAAAAAAAAAVAR